MQEASSTRLSGEEEHTLKYYGVNAHSYADATSNIDMSALYDRFLRYVVSGGLILDAGSGSGRDTLAFIVRGHRVEAIDASPELCELSTKLTGVRTSCLRFQEFNSPPRYDGIWACASLLHVPISDLGDVLQRFARALKPRGAFYMSFKYGSGGRVADDGRFYTDMNQSYLRDLLRTIPDIEIADMWRFTGEGERFDGASWLNAIVLKSAQSERRASKKSETPLWGDRDRA